MNEYTTMKYIVAVKKINRVEELYFASDLLSEAEREYSKEYGPDVQCVKLYNRSSWNGSRRRAMKVRNLLPNSDPIPFSLSMWIVNQADSACF